MSGIEFANDNERRATIGRVVIEGLVAGLVYFVFIRGPLWPMGRLCLLRGHPSALECEGIANPDAERHFSWAALALLAGAAYCLWDGSHTGDIRDWLGMALALGIYLWLTAVIFEDAFMAWWRAPPIDRDERDNRAFVWVSGMFGGALAFALVCTGISHAFCFAFAWCA